MKPTHAQLVNLLREIVTASPQVLPALLARAREALCLTDAAQRVAATPCDGVAPAPDTPPPACDCNYPYLKKRNALSGWRHKTHAPHCAFYEGPMPGPTLQDRLRRRLERVAVAHQRSACDRFEPNEFGSACRHCNLVEELHLLREAAAALEATS